MITITYDKSRSVYELSKTMQGGKHFLKWRSEGLAQFLVLFGADTASLDLRNDQAACALKEELSTHLSDLLANKSCQLKRLNMRCTLFSRNEMMRDGGMAIKETPGNYAVYGMEPDGADAVIYTENPQAPLNLFTMTLEVPVTQCPVMTEKGFFKKTQVFSGYHKVTLQKPFPELAGGVLLYTLDSEKYPFPDEIVTSGGSFYVKADRHATIRFESKNRGIQIK